MERPAIPAATAPLAATAPMQWPTPRARTQSTPRPLQQGPEEEEAMAATVCPTAPTAATAAKPATVPAPTRLPIPCPAPAQRRRLPPPMADRMAATAVLADRLPVAG